ncbi:MAG: S8 family serine peptidase [Polyangiaceae bacterium]|nr:S8 family serine peptidase [Polyangiaceae bacterium]
MMRTKLAWLVAPLLLATSATAWSAPSKTQKLAPEFAAARRSRLQPFLNKGIPVAKPSLPVVIEYERPVLSADLASLEKEGALDVSALSSTSGPLSAFAVANVPVSKLDQIADLEGVVRVSLDGSLFPAPRPLDYTAALVQSSDVWREKGADDLPIDGHGITVCDIDSGIDIFHPLFFRADGNAGKPYMPWVDTDANGIFTPDTDAVDLLGDGNPVVLRTLNSLTTQIWDKDPLFSSDDPALDIGFDYLYADLNLSGVREFGPEAGFTEASPTYGEPLFLVDDVNRNGKLDVGEKLVALGSSKVKAVRFDKKVYLRGQNLIDLPENPDAAHGTGASGVLVGGTPGLTRLVGMAPGADLVMATNTDGTAELQLAKFCRDQGARVVLHEYAPWYGYHLDGSSAMEKFIDSTGAEGMIHVNPAGNLSGSEKLYKHPLTPGQVNDVPVEVPTGYGFTFFGASFLWRDTTRDLVFVVEDPTGFTKELSNTNTIYEPWHDGLTVYATRVDSSRGTARMDFYLFNELQPNPIPTGSWKIHVTDPAAPDAQPVTLIGYVADEISGWGKGIYFPEHQSEEHYIGYPGTADNGMPIAAYTGHGYWGDAPGVRASYSGRGTRIDGEPILWISAPDDPITAGYREGQPSVHFIYGGTSGASPHVAGSAALLLAQTPGMTQSDVKEALKKGALADEPVLSAGPAPNTDYGYGKIQIYQSLFGKAPPGGSAPQITVQAVTVEQGSEGNVPLVLTDPDEPETNLTVDVDRDYDGIFDEVLKGAVLVVPTENLGTFTSKVRVTDSTGRTAAALSVVKVVEKTDLPDPNAKPEVYIGGGGPCSLSAAPRSPREGWFLAGLCLLAVQRKLKRRQRSGSPR